MSETIDFAIYLTGHDEETIKQMYDDWKRCKDLKHNQQEEKK